MQNWKLTNLLQFYTDRNKSKKFSVKLLKEAKESIRALVKYPYLGTLSDNYKTRVLRKKYFSIFYEINIDRIEIISIWDNRKDDSERFDRI